MTSQTLPKLTPIALINAEVGDTVLRIIGGSVPVKMNITEIVGDVVICAGMWTFERDTGLEYDPDLEWGSQWGKTGSVITELIKKA